MVVTFSLNKNILLGRKGVLLAVLVLLATHTLCFADQKSPVQASGKSTPTTNKDASYYSLPDSQKITNISISRNGTGPLASLQSFSPDIFGQKTTTPNPDMQIAKQMDKARRLTPQQKQKILSELVPIKVSGSPPPVPEDAIRPTRRVFPGKKNTMSQFDEQDPSQLHIEYKITNGTAAKVSVNRQDENSPIHTPIKKEEGVNAAGLFFNVAVDDSVKLVVGGEVRNNETVNRESEDASSAGAEMGLRWEF